MAEIDKPHPVGGLIPSKEDDATTQKVMEAAKLLNISLYDHLIVTRDSYYSYADEGRI